MAQVTAAFFTNTASQRAAPYNIIACCTVGKMAKLVLTRMTTSLLFVSTSVSTDPSTDPSIPYPIHGPSTSVWDCLSSLLRLLHATLPIFELVAEPVLRPISVDIRICPLQTQPPLSGRLLTNKCWTLRLRSCKIQTLRLRQLAGHPSHAIGEGHPATCADAPLPHRLMRLRSCIIDGPKSTKSVLDAG